MLQHHKLTAKQDKFAQCIAEGMTQVDAYRTAYDAVNMKPSTMMVKASLLVKQDKVRERVAQLKRELADKQVWRREDSVRVLIEIIEGESRPNEKAQAIKLLNEMHGYNEPTKIEHSGDLGIDLRVNFV